ncbi:SRPBCC domain-containing protein [uncultured Flavobacterium sp.]|uniref:SRPBCC domain-containing protein n=1 Tax=uncultured Flavobacterium sp. TaxID=165435 RepID=UPI0025CCA3B1|nr:SRPBCC domain-containing protein [uncultured Flavobacterium sp.]
MQSTRNTKLINAPVSKVFCAFASAEALGQWLAPDGMTGKVHSFDFRANGGYEMSLHYPEGESQFEGKTAKREDRFTARFSEIVPNEKIVQVTVFESDDERFKGEMKMTVLFEANGNATLVTMLFDNIPPGIAPEDNEEGTQQSLEKLAKYVKQT